MNVAQAASWPRLAAPRGAALGILWRHSGRTLAGLAFDTGAELTAAEEAAIKLALAARASRAARTATAADRTQAVEAAAEAATAAAEAAEVAKRAPVQATERAQERWARKARGKSSKGGADASDRSAQSRSAEGGASHTAEQRTNGGLTATVAEQAAAEQRLLESIRVARLPYATWAAEQAGGQAAARQATAAEGVEETEEPPTFGGFSLSDSLSEPMKSSGGGASFGQRVFSSFASAFGTPRGEPTATAPTAPEAPAAPDDGGVPSQAHGGPSRARGGRGTRRSRYGFRTLAAAYALAEGTPGRAEGASQRTEAVPGAALGPAVGCKGLLAQGKATAAISCFEKVHRHLYDPYDASATFSDAAKQGIGGIDQESLPFDPVQDVTDVLTLRCDAEMWNPKPNPNSDPEPNPNPEPNSEPKPKSKPKPNPKPTKARGRDVELARGRRPPEWRGPAARRRRAVLHGPRQGGGARLR